MKNNREENLILVIDDDEMNLQIARMILEKKLPCKVLTAASSDWGLSIMRGQKVRLVLLDILMPDVDGIETLKQIRADEKLKNIPVMILTASMDRETIRQAVALGVTDYIRKPFMPADLIDRVSRKLAETSPVAGKILLFDENRYTLTKMLDAVESISPYQIDIVLSADEAIEILNTTKVNLIIAGADMKFISGFKLLDFMTRDEKFSKIPFLITTPDEILDAFSKINLTEPNKISGLEDLENSALANRPPAK